MQPPIKAATIVRIAALSGPYRRTADANARTTGRRDSVITEGSPGFSGGGEETSGGGRSREPSSITGCGVLATVVVSVPETTGLGADWAGEGVDCRTLRKLSELISIPAAKTPTQSAREPTSARINRILDDQRCMTPPVKAREQARRFTGALDLSDCIHLTNQVKPNQRRVCLGLSTGRRAVTVLGPVGSGSSVNLDS